MRFDSCKYVIPGHGMGVYSAPSEPLAHPGPHWGSLITALPRTHSSPRSPLEAYSAPAEPLAGFENEGTGGEGRGAKGKGGRREGMRGREGRERSHPQAKIPTTSLSRSLETLL